VTALSLYCDLLEEPGVLTAAHRHYGSELRLLTEASRRLVEKLVLLEGGEEPASRFEMASTGQGRLFAEPPDAGFPLNLVSIESGFGSASESPALIEDFRAEFESSRNLLAAIAGPSITVTATASGGSWPVRMTTENLIRALVNLVKNAAESIPGPGAIKLRLDERRAATGAVRSLILCLEDTGCGIPQDSLERVFEPGFTTRSGEPDGRWTASHRGLGLSITRSIVEAAGGQIHAESRIRAENGAAAANREPGGARFLIELPVRNS